MEVFKKNVGITPDGQASLDAANVSLNGTKLTKEDVSNIVIPAPAQPVDLEQQLTDELLAMSEFQYQTSRESIAKQYGGTLKFYDKLFKSLLASKAQDNSDLSIFADVAPWHEAVDGSQLFIDIEKQISRFVICDPETKTAATLWVIMTYLVDVIHCLPIANITAPEKNCGKSIMLELLSKLSLKPLVTANISSAALFRLIDKYKPTLFLDEADTYMDKSEELRGIINAGHTRAQAFTYRCVGDDNEVVQFEVFCPKAISGIGNRQATIDSRSINMKLRRKLANEKVERLRATRSNEDFDLICRKIVRWCEDNKESIRVCDPLLPTELLNRDMDNWEPLMAIAEHLGRVATQKAITASKILTKADADMSLNQELLHDIKEVFTKLGVERIKSVDLVSELINIDDSRWATYNRGKQFTAKQMADKLKGFNIVPKPMKIQLKSVRGYNVNDFADAFKRYLNLDE